MKPYRVRQLDNSGTVISDRQIEAANTDGALRQLDQISDETQRIDVCDAGNDAGQEPLRQIGAQYWRRNYRNRR